MKNECRLCRITVFVLLLILVVGSVGLYFSGQLEASRAIGGRSGTTSEDQGIAVTLVCSGCDPEVGIELWEQVTMAAPVVVGTAAPNSAGTLLAKVVTEGLSFCEVKVNALQGWLRCDQVQL